MKRFFLYPLCLIISLHQSVNAQTNCKDIDLNKVPGKWVWDKSGGVGNPATNSQWAICEPIRKELQRILPTQVDGIIATNSIAFGYHNLKTFPAAGSPNAYQSYLMVLDYDCIMYPNAKIQPEPATECWVYFDVNKNIESPNGRLLPGGSDVEYAGSPSSMLHLTDVWTETDANGNRVLYTSTEKGIADKRGFLFSANPKLPFRKITRKELYNSYKIYHEKRLNQEIARYEKAITKEQNEYNSLSAAEKKQQSYRLIAIAEAKKSLGYFTPQKEKLILWFERVMKQTNLTDTARAEQIVTWQFEPEKLDAAPGTGFPVWIPDINFYDKTKPADKPQYIFLSYRRQDENLPKKNFMDKFCAAFNLDVLAKMAGETPKKAGGVNTILSSYTDAKIDTKAQQKNDGPQHFSFDNEEGKFPAGWNGMKNISVESYKGNKWLAMTKDGYWYPRQFNKEIKEGFELSFDLRWNPDISYYSGYFTIMLGEMRYDNAAEKYHQDENEHMYRSLYDGYTGNFNRIMLWFDPYWNDGGTLEVYSYDRNEKVKFSKKIVLPGFYKEKNEHHLTIRRKGGNIVVIDNGKTIADIPGVFLPEVTYNLYTFSRYKGDKRENKDDAFYLKDIETKY